MITEEQAITIALQYLKEKKRKYDNLRNVFFNEKSEITRGKYGNTKRDVFVVPYDIEGYRDPILFFINIDKETGEVLYTISAHGCAEDLEE